MDDQNIIALYWARSETAISETAQKYGGYCFSIAKNILTNHEDAEESVNDTYLTAWNAMPPRRPSILATFLGKITRRLAIDRWRYRNACKRGGGEVTLVLRPHFGHRPILPHRAEYEALFRVSIQLKKSPLPTINGQRGFVNLQEPLADCGKRMFLRSRLSTRTGGRRHCHG